MRGNVVRVHVRGEQRLASIVGNVAPLDAHRAVPQSVLERLDQLPSVTIALPHLVARGKIIGHPNLRLPIIVQVNQPDGQCLSRLCQGAAPSTSRDSCM